VGLRNGQRHAESEDGMTTDHKGYEIKSRMDWQDRLILWACVLAVLMVAGLVLGGVVE